MAERRAPRPDEVGSDFRIVIDPPGVHGRARKNTGRRNEFSTICVMVGPHYVRGGGEQDLGSRPVNAFANEQARRNYGLMKTQSPDTSPEVERVWVELLRQVPACRKVAMVEDVTQAARQLAWIGLRQRYP